MTQSDNPTTTRAHATDACGPCSAEQLVRITYSGPEAMTDDEVVWLEVAKLSGHGPLDETIR